MAQQKACSGFSIRQRPQGRARRSRLGGGIFLGMLGVVVGGFALAQGNRDIPAEVRDRSRNLDVPFAVSHATVVKTMLDMAKVSRTDYVIDLGSGDGRIVIAAARDYGAQGFGVDLNKGLVDISNRRAQQAGLTDRVRFFVRDIFKTDLGRASVITMYLYPEVVLRLRPRLLDETRPGTRIVSHEWHLGDWRPDAIGLAVNDKGVESPVYMWTVPAKAAGIWQWEIDYPDYFENTLRYRATIRQSFQDIAGEIEIRQNPLKIRDAVLKGSRIAFSATGEIEHRIIRHDFEGTVKGNRMSGTVRLGGAARSRTLPWQAWRAGGFAP